MFDDDDNIPIDQGTIDCPSQSTDSIHEAPTRKKKKMTFTDTELQGLIDKLTDRVEGSRGIPIKVVEMIKAVENPHTANAK